MALQLLLPLLRNRDTSIHWPKSGKFKEIEPLGLIRRQRAHCAVYQKTVNELWIRPE